MEWLALISLLAIIEYLWIGGQVGMARGRYEIEAPATTGHEIFERHFRVHQNTAEQLIVFLPALWIFGTYMSAPVGAGIGALFIVGRVVYAIGYVKDPSSRTAGFAIGYLANAALVLGGLAGVVMALL